MTAEYEAKTGLGGMLRVLDESTGVASWTSTPTKQTGRLTHLRATPQATLYGTHIIGTTPAWTIQNELGAPVESSATLYDGYEAVDGDGNAVTQPTYMISILARDPTIPPTVRLYVGPSSIDE